MPLYHGRPCPYMVELEVAPMCLEDDFTYLTRRKTRIQV